MTNAAVEHIPPRPGSVGTTPLKVLLVTHSLPPADRPLANVGGMQSVAAGLARALEEHHNVELHLLALRASWSETGHRTGPFLVNLLWKIPRVVRTESIDVVLFSSMVTATVTSLLGGRLRKQGVKTAAIVHGNDVTLPVAVYQRIVPRVFRSLDLILPVSRATRDECVIRGAPISKLRVAPNGIDIAHFEAPRDRSAARSQLSEWFPDPSGSLCSDTFLLASVGRHVRRKGFAWFVREVMGLLGPEVQYWIAGEGPETSSIAHEIARRGLERRVRLLGTVSEEKLHTLLGAADLHLMPNIPVPGEIEGFGVVILEAAACGLPTLAADAEGMRDVVQEGVNGYLVKGSDARGFATRIAQLADDRMALRTAGRSALAHTKAQFDWRVVSDKHVGVLSDLVRRV
jgi:phosphatidylinositol alpha-1,6-mannosyltransferase